MCRRIPFRWVVAASSLVSACNATEAQPEPAGSQDVAAAIDVPAQPPAEVTTPTPEEVVSKAQPGDAVVVQGVVYTLSFDLANHVPSTDRWVLIRTVVPTGVTLDDFELGNEPDDWTLGLHLTAADLAKHTFPVPQVGDVVRAEGTFARTPWNGGVRPTVELTTLTVLSGAAPLPLAGAPCTSDMGCADDLVCDRATLLCASPKTVIAWDSPWRNVNGACDVDEDCPAGQLCDAEYSIPANGAGAAHYAVERDTGRSLCVPAPGATQGSLCPRFALPADLVGGRWVPGKEVCVEGVVFGTMAFEGDGDTHIQIKLDEPFPYPAPEVSYWASNGTSEIGVTYKNTDHGGATSLENPKEGQRIRLIGTYRFDDGHDWFEVHPIKAWWVVP